MSWLLLIVDDDEADDSFLDAGRRPSYTKFCSLLLCQLTLKLSSSFIQLRTCAVESRRGASLALGLARDLALSCIAQIVYIECGYLTPNTM